MNRMTKIAVAAACLIAVAAPAAAQQVIKLATLVPEGSVWDRMLRDTGSEWNRATAGRVTLRVYPGGVAGDEPDVVRKMRIGQLQAGALTTVGLAEIDPGFQLFNAPMFFDSYGELDAVLDEIGPTLRQRLEAKGFVLLSWGHGGWVYFFSKKPVQTIADLKATKMFAWAGDDRMVQLWRANGFHPVALAATDIMTGLQTGMIETFPSTPLIALTLQWYRITPNMVGVGLAPLVGGFVVSKAAWDKISPADRAAIQAAALRGEKHLEVEVPRQDTTAVAEMEKRGLKVMRLPAAQRTEFRGAAGAFAAGMRGGVIPVDVLEAATKARDAYRKRAGAAP
jgi:TRAP-type C4-dicarboxylate transport system substrate-binding protein